MVLRFDVENQVVGFKVVEQHIVENQVVELTNCRKYMLPK
jgi:hypothetical protein